VLGKAQMHPMNRIPLRDGVLAAISGLMLTAIFPPLSIDWLAWVSLIPLLLSLRGKSSIVAIELGLITGLVHYLTLIYWIIVVLSHYGNLNPLLSSFALLLLCLYLAVYAALFALIWNSLKGDRLSSFWGACVWVALEYARAYIMTGFPWCLIGYSQYLRLALIQVSDISGVYGVSFIIVLANLILYHALFTPHTQRRRPVALRVIFLALLMGCILAYGYHSTKVKTETTATESRIRVVIVQGNVDQSIKWNPAYQKKTVALYRELSIESGGFRPDLIVWPETALPFFFQDRTDLSREVFDVARKTDSSILFGSPAYEKDGKGITYHNRAYIVSEDRVLDYYDKVHLVPFGEYVPLRRYLPFIQRVVPAAGDFSSGKNLRPIRAADLRLGTIICFEAIFPEISRELATQGAQLLVNLTNDAWFGRTGAPHQHLSMAVFRCVENGLSMARAANTGISAFILANGKIVSESPLFDREVLKGELDVNRTTTFYSQFGDIFAILLSALAILRLCWKFGIRRR